MIAREILYLPVTNNQHIQSIEYGLGLIQAYSSQQNAAMMEENAKMREVLESFINDHALGYTAMTDFMITQANEALERKP